MKTINLHGVVGWDIDAKEFSENLDNTTGDILLDLNSGGGYITDGVAIFNKIKSYDKGKIIARVSFAASMMTQIALATDEVQVYGNSIFMIHNAQGGAYGDYREMAKRGKILKALTHILAKTYEKKSGKNSKAILDMMDAETYFFGEEIKSEGFADTLLGESNTGEKRTKDEAIAFVSLQLEAVNKALKEENASIEALSACVGDCDLEKLGYNNTAEASTFDRSGGCGPSTNSKKGDDMNVSQLKADHPDLFAEVVGIGVNQERERVSAHLTMGEASGDMPLAVTNITNGEELSATINAKYMAAHMKRKELNDRQDENVGDMNTNENDDNVNDDEAMAKEVAKLLGGDNE